MKKTSFTKDDSIGNKFQIESKKRVNEYFISSKKTKYGGYLIYQKAIVLLLALCLNYCVLVFFQPESWSLVTIFLYVLLCITLGGLTASIGFNVMHDGSHGSFSKKEWLNELAGLTLNLLGGNLFFWKGKHVIKHHTYTNVWEEDEDPKIPFLRTTRQQKRKPYHKYQHIYVHFFYLTTYFLWVYVTDFVKYFSKKDRSGESMPMMNLAQRFIFWISKIVHVFLFVGLPLTVMDWKVWLVGFIIFNISCGRILSIVFQMAHVMPNTEFPSPDEKGKINRNWALHQLATTTNFATRNRFLSWWIGGLNFQREHHVFPKISHVHYPAINKILKNLCIEFGVPNLEYGTFREAKKAHFSYLKDLGTRD